MSSWFKERGGVKTWWRGGVSRLPRITIITTLFFLTSCGFQPMYGDAAMQANKTPLQGNLSVGPINGPKRESQILKIALEDIFNPEGIKYASPDYRLQVTLHINLIPAVVKSDGTIQRYDIRIDSDFSLFQNGNPKALFTGSLRRVGSFDVATTEEFATYVAQEDITERTLKEMAQDYLLRMSGYFAKQPQ
jgi:hypothetical protein